MPPLFEPLGAAGGAGTKAVDKLSRIAGTFIRLWRKITQFRIGQSRVFIKLKALQQLRRNVLTELDVLVEEITGIDPQTSSGSGKLLPMAFDMFGMLLPDGTVRTAMSPLPPTPPTLSTCQQARHSSDTPLLGLTCVHLFLICCGWRGVFSGRRKEKQGEGGMAPFDWVFQTHTHTHTRTYRSPASRQFESLTRSSWTLRGPTLWARCLSFTLGNERFLTFPTQNGYCKCSIRSCRGS